MTVLYRQIAQEIETRIQNGTYRPGEKIPSIRELARSFGCNKLTVQKAFDHLKNGGIIDNVVGSGTYVRYPEQIERGGKVFDFKTAYLSEDLFPYRKANAIFTELLDTEAAGAFSAAPVEGDPDFLKALGKWYRLPAENMFVISGAQQGLDLITKVFSARLSETVLFEDPTYPGAISLFKAKHFVPMEADGPDIDQLRQKSTPSIQLFYTMPSVHNPMGISYSEEKKAAVVAMARTHHFYIIEDDYLGEYLDRPAPRFIDLCPERTIFIKSLSQTTVSGIRLGFISVPKNLYDRFLYAKYLSDIASNGLMQKFFQRFIASGEYSAYVDATRRRIEDRRGRLLERMTRYPEIHVALPQHGCSIWFSCPGAHWPFEPPWTWGRAFSFSQRFRNFARLSFMNLDDPTFEDGLDYLDTCFVRLGAAELKTRHTR